MLVKATADEIRETAAGVEDEDLRNSILEAIAERINSGEFPPVQPSEVDEMMRRQAREALSWVRKDQSVRIQSYME